MRNDNRLHRSLPLCGYTDSGVRLGNEQTDHQRIELKKLFTELTTNNMAQKFYTKWQNSVLADAKTYVSKEYRQFQTALIFEISNYAKSVDATVIFSIKGHYDTSCFVGRNSRFVYISHSSGLSRRADGVRMDLASFLIRTARHEKDYTGGNNHYCNLSKLQSMIDELLTR